MLSKLKSELAYLIGLVAIIGLGFIKVVIPSYPFAATIGGVITLTLGLYGKRLAQKHMNFNGSSKQPHNYTGE